MADDAVSATQCDLGHVDRETVIALVSQEMETAPGTSVMLHPVETPSVPTRVLDAALVCVARFGVAKTTLDDVAGEAGCSRATLYRHFANKAELLGCAFSRDGDRIIAEVGRVAAEEATLEDALVAMATTAARELAEHPALSFVLSHEPELVLPMVTFDAGSQFLVRTADVLAPMLARFVAPARVERAAEWVARVFFIYFGEQAATILMTDADQVRELVCDFVVPGLTNVSSQPQG